MKAVVVIISRGGGGMHHSSINDLWPPHSLPLLSPVSRTWRAHMDVPPAAYAIQLAPYFAAPLEHNRERACVPKAIRLRFMSFKPRPATFERLETVGESVAATGH